MALPADARTKEQLEWLADEVIEAGGEATVWLGRPGSAADERRLAGRMATAIGAEYQEVVADAQVRRPASPRPCGGGPMRDSGDSCPESRDATSSRHLSTSRLGKRPRTRRPVTEAAL